MDFRQDINGLRAIAVIAVVVFHFEPMWLPGGFAGVDVFFVISGYLMTGIIFSKLEKGQFSILQFYVARANRIVPALAMLCAVLLVFGWLYLPPLDFTELGKNIASSLAFISNITYWNSAGYFAAAAHENWLLHTWSLSVEWQFYILYPIVLVLLSRVLTLKNIKWFVLAATVIGFTLSVVVSYRFPNAAYFLLPTRAWEMMVGGLAFLFPFSVKVQYKRTLELFAFAMILASYLLINGGTPWPGILAIFPVLGTFLIIQTYRKGSILTGNKIFQSLGRWSYSIYLWHWPILVGSYYFTFSVTQTLLSVLAILSCGYLSYRYIERLHFNTVFTSISSYLTCKPLLIGLGVAALGGVTFATDGVIEHYPSKVIELDIERKNTNKWCVANELWCFIGNKENVNAIIVGDSHAKALATALHTAMLPEQPDSGVLLLSFPGCPLVVNAYFKALNGRCHAINEERIAVVQSHPANIPVYWAARTAKYIFGQSNPSRVSSQSDLEPSMYFSQKYSSAENTLFSEFEQALDDTFKQLSENRPLFVILPTPEMRKNVPKEMVKNLLIGREDQSISVSKELYFDRNDRLRGIIERAALRNDGEILDPTMYLCDHSVCSGTEDGRPLYSDGDHLSEFGNKRLTPMFKASTMVDR